MQQVDIKSLSDLLISCKNDDMMATERRFIKLMKRIAALPGGRHQITLTVGDGVEDWTVTPLGKVEQ